MFKFINNTFFGSGASFYAVLNPYLGFLILSKFLDDGSATMGAGFC